MISSCAETRSLLHARPLHALDEDEDAFVEKHLAGCDKCRARARALDRAFFALHRSGPVRREPGADPLWEKIKEAIDRAPPRVPETATPLVTISLVCCFCRDAVARAEAAYCASCLAPHHDECFRAHGRCSAPGCEETRTVRPDAAPARRRPLRVVAAVLLVGSVAAAAALTTNVIEYRRHKAEVERVRAEAEVAYREKLQEVLARVRLRIEREGVKIDLTDVAKPIDPVELEAKIDAIFEKIEKLIADKEIDQLTPLFGQLMSIMDEYKNVGTDTVAAKLKKYEKRLDEWKEVRLAILLQIYINQGNELLRHMIKARQTKNVPEARAAFAEVVSLVDRMKEEEREEFHRNADAIYLRAAALRDEVEKSR